MKSLCVGVFNEYQKYERRFQVGIRLKQINQLFISLVKNPYLNALVEILLKTIVTHHLISYKCYFKLISSNFLFLINLISNKSYS